MSRGWNIGDLLGIGNLTGNPDPIYGSLSGQNAIKDATAVQQAALAKAFEVIQQYTSKAIEQQQPYTQHAGEDFNRMRGLVQSGYFQTPGQGFTPPQRQAPNGFTMNPAQGMASFQPQTNQVNSYTPQGLPPMPNMPAYQPPPPMGGLMGGQQGQQPPPLQPPPQGRGLLEQPLSDVAGRMAGRYADSFTQDPFAPKDPLGMMADSLKDKLLSVKLPSTGNPVLDQILNPVTPLKVASDAGDATKRIATKAVKKTWSAIKGAL